MRAYRTCTSENLTENLCEQEGIYKPIKEFSYVLYKNGTCKSYKRICRECDYINRQNNVEDVLDLKHAQVLLQKMGYEINGETSIHHQFLKKFEL